MELDDFRARWQQSAGSDIPAALGSKDVIQLLQQKARNSVTAMLRSAWGEVSFTVLFLAAGVFGFIRAERLFDQMMMGWLILLGVVSIVSYHRHMFSALQGMRDAEASVREQLTRQVEQVRTIMRKSYRSSLWSLVISLGLPMAYTLVKLGQEVAIKQKLMPIFWLTIAFYALVTYSFTRFVRWFSAKHFQHLYGRHLDQLEAALRELRD